MLLNVVTIMYTRLFCPNGTYSLCSEIDRGPVWPASCSCGDGNPALWLLGSAHVLLCCVAKVIFMCAFRSVVVFVDGVHHWYAYRIHRVDAAQTRLRPQLQFSSAIVVYAHFLRFCSCTSRCFGSHIFAILAKPINSRPSANTDCASRVIV